jgi:hypothetical protein
MRLHGFYASLMKLRILSVALIFLASSLSPASAATVTDKIVYNKKTVVTYSVVDSLTLDPKGCKDVYINYTIDKSYFFPNAYVMFGLYAKDKNEAQSVYVQPGNGKGTQGKDAWVGTKEMIFCGKPKSFVNEYGDKVDAPAFSKGKYTFIARFIVVKPKLVTTPAKEIAFTVK